MAYQATGYDYVSGNENYFDTGGGNFLISQEFYIAAHIKKFLLESSDNYTTMDRALMTDMATTPAFQTFYSFLYYYFRAGGGAEECGQPCRDWFSEDLYDKRNVAGEMEHSQALYPTIVVFDYQAVPDSCEAGPDGDCGDGGTILDHPDWFLPDGNSEDTEILEEPCDDGTMVVSGYPPCEEEAVSNFWETEGDYLHNWALDYTTYETMDPEWFNLIRYRYLDDTDYANGSAYYSDSYAYSPTEDFVSWEDNTYSEYTDLYILPNYSIAQGNVINGPTTTFNSDPAYYYQRSQWFLVDGDDYPGQRAIDMFTDMTGDGEGRICVEHHDTYEDPTDETPPGSNYECIASMSELPIFQMYTKDPTDCTTELHVEIYQDGELYSSGSCADMPSLPSGLSILEVWSNTVETDCFSFMDDHYCHDVDTE